MVTLSQLKFLMIFDVNQCGDGLRIWCDNTPIHGCNLRRLSEQSTRDSLLHRERKLETNIMIVSVSLKDEGFGWL